MRTVGMTREQYFNCSIKHNYICWVSPLNPTYTTINQGLDVLSEKNVFELYRDRKITLQKAAEMLSLDIWEIIEKLKKADIHIDYSKEELAEDLR